MKEVSISIDIKVQCAKPMPNWISREVAFLKVPVGNEIFQTVAVPINKIIFPDTLDKRGFLHSIDNFDENVEIDNLIRECVDESEKGGRKEAVMNLIELLNAEFEDEEEEDGQDNGGAGDQVSVVYSGIRIAGHKNLVSIILGKNIYSSNDGGILWRKNIYRRRFSHLWSSCLFCGRSVLLFIFHLLFLIFFLGGSIILGRGVSRLLRLGSLLRSLAGSLCGVLLLHLVRGLAPQPGKLLHDVLRANVGVVALDCGPAVGREELVCGGLALDTVVVPVATAALLLLARAGTKRKIRPCSPLVYLDFPLTHRRHQRSWAAGRRTASPSGT